MRRWALPTPDEPAWSVNPRYRPDAAPALRAACALLACTEPNDAELNYAFRHISPLISQSLCPQQSIRILYVEARVKQGERTYDRAIEKVNQALTIANTERLIPEEIELLSYKGELERCLSRYVSAASNLRESLRLLTEVEEYTGMKAIEQRFELLWQLATYTFAQGDFANASQQVEEALSLHPLVPHLTYEAASVLWVKALLERTRGNLHAALGLAMGIANQLEHDPLASTATRDRIACFVAEIALDIAERTAEDSSAARRDPFVLLARNYLRKAAELAKESHDHAGAAQVKLARVRKSRLRGKNEHRIARIEQTIRLADQLNDVALRAHALTTLGDEYAHRKETELALNCYRETLDVLARSEVSAYCVRPRRMLLRYSEHGTLGRGPEG